MRSGLPIGGFHRLACMKQDRTSKEWLGHFESPLATGQLVADADVRYGGTLPPAGGETRAPRGAVVGRASPREVTRDTPPLAPTDETDFVLKQLLTIADRAAEHHFAITKDLLARTEGERFDQGFVSMQLADRARVLAQLRAMKEIGSPPFREIIQTAEGLTQGHLASAEELSARSNKR